MFEVERDPFFSKLENETLSKLAEIVPPEPVAPVKSNKQLPSDNKFVSVEDALKELEELNKKGLL